MAQTTLLLFTVPHFCQASDNATAGSGREGWVSQPDGVSIHGAPCTYSVSCNVYCNLSEEHLLLRQVLLAQFPTSKSKANSVLVARDFRHSMVTSIL